MKECFFYADSLHLPPFNMLRTCVFSLLIASTLPTLFADEQLNPQQLDFFEKKVRPLLVKHCYECHSVDADDAQGGLLLDSKQGWMTGGDSGPAITPGKPDESLFIKAIHYKEIEMPPDGRLDEGDVATLTAWVKMGAPDPRNQTSDKQIKPTHVVDIEAGRQFWAFQPPVNHATPMVTDTSWPETWIDRFVLAALEKRGIAPSEDTGRSTWLRRVTFDLSGLPPTTAEINAFENDESPFAFERVVDRLLASPRYGETWGRHWLDVARYADSNGSDFNATFHNAWRYRDYVIASFNADRPYDEFVQQQIAGDLLESESPDDRIDQLVASGFLLMGPKMLSERDKEKLRMDVVDEQVDSIGRAFLGLTLGCARCHDHKFDPIPTADYYAMAGILRSTESLYGESQQYVSTWREEPLPIDPAHATALAEYNSQKKKIEGQLGVAKKMLANAKSPQSYPGIIVDNTAAKLVGQWKASTFSPKYFGVGYVHDDRLDKGEKSATFSATVPTDGEYEVRVSYTPGANRAKKVPIQVKHAAGQSEVFLDQSPTPSINGLFQPVGRFNFRKGEPAIVTISNRGTVDYVIVDAVWFFPLNEAKDKQANEAPDNSEQIAAAEKEVKSLEAELKALKATAPAPAPKAMAARDHEDIGNSHIHIRGEVHALGERVDRGFLQVVGNPDDWRPSRDESGRKALAEWVISGEHPLTSRVMVNRIWSRLLGRGIVASVDNLGNLGSRPTHPELLDRLAISFVDNGWSVKQMVRQIVLSRVYRVSSSASEDLQTEDPKNELLGRFSRRRLPVEAVRDSILVTADQLDLSKGGSPVEGYGTLVVDNNSQAGGRKTRPHSRRTVYLPIIRNDLPEMLTVFDFADPDVVMGARPQTTSPSQALFLMNNRLVREHAEVIAKNAIEAASAGDPLDSIYLRLLSRRPTASERENIEAFIERIKAERPDDANANEQAWTTVCHTLMASAGFRFLE